MDAQGSLAQDTDTVAALPNSAVPAYTETRNNPLRSYVM